MTTKKQVNCLSLQKQATQHSIDLQCTIQRVDALSEMISNHLNSLDKDYYKDLENNAKLFIRHEKLIDNLIIGVGFLYLTLIFFVGIELMGLFL